ncbi:beta-glucosidase [Lachnospiraceae bacterium NK3A20]|nr:beta-glucosidase [Lachnospiraceae bacterium NK3A20]
MNKWTRSLYQPNLPLYEGKPKVTASPAHIALSKDAAKEGMVLMKNKGGVLPLAKGARVALFGKGTFDYVKGGGGSGDVTVPYIHNIYDGFCSLSDEVSVFEGTADFYRDYVRDAYAKGGEPGLIREPEISNELVWEAAAYTDTAVISISRFSGEGWDRKSSMGAPEAAWDSDRKFMDLQDSIFPKSDFYLTPEEEAMVNKVQANFSKVIVVMNVGGMVDSTWFKNNDMIQAVLMAWQGGMEGGTAAAELIMGHGNPSGKLSDTFARELEDYPSTAGFHESASFVNYTEDIYVGYRYFETIPGAAEKVNYPFGYGLSYTKFRLTQISASVKEVPTGAEDPEAPQTEEVITFLTQVTNVGSCAGREVVQIYAEAPQGQLGKPSKVLAGYQKTRLLSPGDSQFITIDVRLNSLASYDDIGRVRKSSYVLEKGDYHFFIGTSIRDGEESPFTYTIEENLTVLRLVSRMSPTELPMRLRADGSYENLSLGKTNDPNETALGDWNPDAAAGHAPAVRAEDRRMRFGKPALPQLSDVATGKMELDEFISKLPVEILIHLLGGQPNTGVANTFGFGNVSEYGIPNIMTADGPAGLRVNKETGVTTTAFPCATLLACTWDPDTTYAVGRAGGEEVKENNICVWLTPAVNIHRSPRCGRNFEYYSEDPLLAGRQAAAMVRGIQSNNVAAAVKHFALNDKETNRRDSDSRASERAIREIYLKQFEIIVKEAHPWSIMTSYNIINGHRASENKDLIDGILRQEWGFDGVVMTDWWNKAEHYKEVIAGNDIKMATGLPERLQAAYDNGLINRAQLEKAAKNVLGLILRVD